MYSKEINKKKVPIVYIDKSLEKFKKLPLFQYKVGGVNKVLTKITSQFIIFSLFFLSCKSNLSVQEIVTKMNQKSEIKFRDLDNLYLEYDLKVDEVKNIKLIKLNKKIYCSIVYKSTSSPFYKKDTVVQSDDFNDEWLKLWNNVFYPSSAISISDVRYENSYTEYKIENKNDTFQVNAVVTPNKDGLSGMFGDRQLHYEYLVSQNDTLIYSYSVLLDSFIVESFKIEKYMLCKQKYIPQSGSFVSYNQKGSYNVKEFIYSDSLYVAKKINELIIK